MASLGSAAVGWWGAVWSAAQEPQCICCCLFIPHLRAACPLVHLTQCLPSTPPPSPRLAPQDECLTLGTGLNLQAQPCLRASCPASLSTLNRGCEGHQHDRLSRCQASDWGHCCPVHSALKTGPVASCITHSMLPLSGHGPGWYPVSLTLSS